MRIMTKYISRKIRDTLFAEKKAHAGRSWLTTGNMISGSYSTISKNNYTKFKDKTARS
jgi:hypothetical protein